MVEAVQYLLNICDWGFWQDAQSSLDAFFVKLGRKMHVVNFGLGMNNNHVGLQIKQFLQIIHGALIHKMQVSLCPRRPPAIANIDRFGFNEFAIHKIQLDSSRKANPPNL
jgi:hypothetical protein